MEDLLSFFIEYNHNGEKQLAEVKPCCQQEDIFYYDISLNNTYQFTITPSSNETSGFSWRLALKNADKQVDPEIIQLIGEQIDNQIMS